ncbi:hypothetical protein LCGC14_1564530 [marine sediment metagenome]|uniref:Uncharacterized protein n=1 Tax=marine sediment metagenome TaxID=412755 RepID=A0A0F9ILG3_9ZZZZ
MKPWGLYFMLAGFAIWWSLFAPMRRPAPVREESFIWIAN